MGFLDSLGDALMQNSSAIQSAVAGGLNQDVYNNQQQNAQYIQQQQLLAQRQQQTLQQENLRALMGEYNNQRAIGTLPPGVTTFDQFVAAQGSSGLMVPQTALGQPDALAATVSGTTAPTLGMTPPANAPPPNAPLPSQATVDAAPTLPKAPAPTQVAAQTDQWTPPQGMTPAAIHQRQVTIDEQQSYAQKKQDQEKLKTFVEKVKSTDPAWAAEFEAAPSDVQKKMLDNKYATTDTTQVIRGANGNAWVLDKRTNKGTDTGVKMAPTAAQVNVSTGTGSSNLTDGGMQVYQELIRAGKPIPKDGRGKVDFRVLNAMAEGEAGGAGSGDIVASQADYKSNQSALTQTANRETAVNRTIGAVKVNQPRIESLINKLNNSIGGEFGNTAMNTLVDKFGDNKDLAELRNLVFAASREYVIATTMPGSNAQMHIQHADEAQEMMNMNMPPNKLLGAFKGMNEDMDASKVSLQDEKKRLHDALRNKPSTSTAPTPSGAITKTQSGATVSGW